MYHPHADEMVQMAMGMMGFWVTHPKNPGLMQVDRDFVFLLERYDIEPGELHAAGQHDARLQSVRPSTAASSRASIRWWCGRATACASASAI